jgi:hypothetical protein
MRSDGSTMRWWNVLFLSSVSLRGSERARQVQRDYWLAFRVRNNQFGNLARRS